MHSNSTTATAAQALGKLCGHAKPPFFIGKKGIETLILQGCFRSRGNPGRALITADTGLLVPKTQVRRPGQRREVSASPVYQSAAPMCTTGAGR